jgi:ElaB/YqjD/DUF883 family membrane-anchored ribosome-binding protein
MKAPGSNGASSATRDPEQIQRDIERTREELAATVAAVAEKADVKRQAKRRVDETKSRVQDNPAPLAIGAAAVLALIVWLIRR